MDATGLPTNRLAVISLVFAVLTVFSLCIGWAPFLLGSSLICYPAAIFFGALALISGLAALRRENGRGMALTGIWLGGLTILATICLIALSVSALAAFITQVSAQPTP